MATVYKIDLVSDWIDYKEEDICKLILESLNPDKRNFRINSIEKQ